MEGAWPAEILIATGNAGKAKEFREMLASGKRRWTDLSIRTGAQTVEETGQTFHENACLKATGYALQFSSWTLADDSGLEIDALGGAPGVLSARWADVNRSRETASPPGSTPSAEPRTSKDDRNNALLLRQLQDVPDDQRTGRFVCILALSDAQGRIVLTARDTVEGLILRSPRGSNGFGYDPLFFVPSLGKTTAEMTPDEKHRISHRGKALRRLSALMSEQGLA